MANKFQRSRRCDAWVLMDTEKWRKYPADETNITEEECRLKEDHTELEKDTIHFQNFLRMNKFNKTKQKIVKSISLDDIRYLREEQFSLSSHNDLSRQTNTYNKENNSEEQKILVTNTSTELNFEKQINDFNVPKESVFSPPAQKIKANFRSLSENNLPQKVYESHYKSCPTLSFEWLVNTNQNDDILISFRSKLFAILSGSASGLASVGLQNLVKRYTNVSLPDNDTTAWNIIEPHFSKGPPRIRLEAVFEIFQQYIDPNLSLLDVLMTDKPSIDRSHDILAMLALTSTVVTTNFDHLIEDAGCLHFGDDQNIVPFDVFFTEEHFKKAFDSINTDSLPNLKGLWKIHGTVAFRKNKKRILVRADEDGGPVATLKTLSLTRESIERRYFLHYLLETRPFIIIDYSAMNDFDVTHWLKSVKSPLNVLWIQHIDNSCEPVFWSGIDIAEGIPQNITSFDRSLITIACAWHERGIGDHLKVVTTSDSIGFLLQIIPLNIPPHDNHIHRFDSYEEYSLSAPTTWQSYILSGAMLSHLSYFSEAKKYFDYAVNISIKGTREYCIARLAAAEASIEIGDRMGRIQAMNDAIDAAKKAPLALKSWSKRKSQFISATVKRFVEQDGQAIAIEELQELLNQYGKPEDHRQGREKNVAFEAAILLAQLRRFLPGSPEPSDIAKQWIESVPKTSLLHTKGMNLHETALNKYQLATNIEDIDDAINTIKEALEIREELGHMRGLVASLNVLGSMQMRRADWNETFEIKYVKYAAEEFRRSIEYSDKHASIFDQFQARIHLAICLFRYPFIANTTEELFELLNYFQTHTIDDIRTEIETEFCLAMSIFLNSTLSLDAMYNHVEELFNNLANKYLSNQDIRLIRIRAAARFNSELCQDWKKGQVHTPNTELTRDIITRKIQKNGNVYWNMRILRAEQRIPIDKYDRLQLLLDPLSP